MVQKRWKRKSGYVTPNLTIPKKELIKNDLFVNQFYDDWNNPEKSKSNQRVRIKFTTYFGMMGQNHSHKKIEGDTKQ